MNFRKGKTAPVSLLGQLPTAVAAELINKRRLVSIPMTKNIRTDFSITAMVPASDLLAFKDGLME
jgi:hypothetical protein